MIVKCLFCKNKFITWPQRIRIGKGKFCSKKCFDLFQTRMHHSPKTEFKNGEHLKENHPRWKGGKYINWSGYVLVREPSHLRANSSGYVREHILIVEKIIRRPVKISEAVHHINGIKSDNRPENLYLFLSTFEHKQYEASKSKSQLISNLI